VKYNIAFIDPFGMPYRGDTLQYRGLGGAESAVIYMATELADFGHDVTVFNNDKSNYFNRVQYAPLQEVEQYYNFDVVVVLRSIYPFIPKENIGVKERYNRNIKLPDFSKIIETATYKVLWRHDTYCDGDELIPNLDIDKVFTLSDWHTEHTSSKLKINNIWQTRNGYTHFYVDTKNKDPDLFVYNAAAYKGLSELISNVWPRVKAAIPHAKLIIIGGYYNGLQDANYAAIKSYRNDLHMEDLNISFTGIITPEEVAKVVAKSTYMIYPCIFPETFGISTLEAIAYQTIPITINIGALQTTAIDECSFKLDGYDAEEFAQFVINIYGSNMDKKIKACRQVWDRDTWEVVSLEWNEHFINRLQEKKPMKKLKSILIAVPTAVRIECETFKAIYELKIPKGYRADFRYFWCYLIDQGRNTIANYAIQNNYDYLFAIDADIEVPSDALEKMLSYDKDFICGMYRMRRPEEVIEIYDTGYRLLPPTLLKTMDGLLQVGGCGFGCVLVKTKVLEAIGYPQFEYHQAYRFDQVFSEDNDFCRKATNKGFKLYCDTSIRCRHKGTVMWEIAK